VWSPIKQSRREVAVARLAPTSITGFQTGITPGVCMVGLRFPMIVTDDSGNVTGHSGDRDRRL